MPAPSPLHLAVALEGAGWHPAAWREPDARPAEVFTADYWVELARRAEKAGLDFVTLEDGLGLQSSAPNGRPDGRTDQLRGRLDALLIAARVAPLTHRIGLVPSVTVTHTEPFHTSKAVATLDYVSTGWAGVRVQVSARTQDAEHFGRRTLPEESSLDRDRSRPPRRGGRLRGGRPPPVGQLGGRRRDPRRGDRAVRRPGEAPLHRFRRPVVPGEGTVDHAPPAAGTATRHGPRPLHPSVPVRRPAHRSRVRHAS